MQTEKGADSSPKSIFYLWCETTTFHGWSDWLNAKSFVARCCWSFLLLVCVSALSLSLYSLITSFARSDKWTTSVYEAQGQQTPLPFPSVTICNSNRLKYSVAKEYNFTQPLRSYFFSQFPVKYPLTTDSLSPTATAEEYGAWRKEHNMTFQKIMDLMGNNCSQLLQMRIGGNAPVDSICSDETQERMRQIGVAFSEVTNSEYGRCFQLNFDPAVFNVTQTGSGNGISMILNIGTEEYLPDIMNNFMDEGEVLQVDYNERVTAGTWTMLTPGTHTYVGLQTHETRKKSSSFFNLFPPPCVEEPNMKILPNVQYSRRGCEVDCELVGLNRTCGCVVMMKEEEAGGTSICEFDEIHSCMNERKDNSENYQKDYRRCASKCEPPCTTRKVEHILSTTKFPSSKQLPTLKDLMSRNDLHWTEQEIASTFSAVDIYFTTLQVSVVQRYELYSLDGLMSQIGGSLGLWAGISVLTVCHAGLYFLYWITSCFPCFRNQPIKE